MSRSGNVLSTSRAGDEGDRARANVDDEIYATQGHLLCTCKGPLGDGVAGSDRVLTCPWHGWQYDVRTGLNEFDHAINLSLPTRCGSTTAEIQVSVLSCSRRGIEDSSAPASTSPRTRCWRPRLAGRREADERDFFQGLVHVAVAWYQAGRGNRTGCERQLDKG